MSEKSYAKASNLHALTKAAKTYSKAAATYAVVSKAYMAATGSKSKHSTPYPDCPECARSAHRKSSSHKERKRDKLLVKAGVKEPVKPVKPVEERRSSVKTPTNHHIVEIITISLFLAILVVYLYCLASSFTSIL